MSQGCQPSSIPKQYHTPSITTSLVIRRLPHCLTCFQVDWDPAQPLLPTSHLAEVAVWRKLASGLPAIRLAPRHLRLDPPECRLGLLLLEPLPAITL